MRPLSLTSLTFAVLAAAATPADLAPQAGNNPPPARSVISGVVLDHESNQPLEGAVVSITGAGVGRGLQEISDAQGRFAFRNLTAGDTYNLMASKVGYFGGSYGRNVPQLSASPVRGRFIVLRDGETFGTARIFLWRPASISGFVRNEHDEPVVGAYVRTLARVIVSGEPRLAGGPAAVTDDRGAFRIANLVKNDYVVALTTLVETGPQGAPTRDAANNSARASSLLYYAGSRTAAGAVAVSVNFGDDRAGVDFQIPHVAVRRIVGRAEGPPDAIRSAMLRLVPTGDESLGVGAEAGTTSPKDDGTFMFANVPAGRYSIRVTPSLGELTLQTPPISPCHPGCITEADGASRMD